MKVIRLTAPTLALLLVVAVSGAARATGAPHAAPTPALGQDRDRGWDMPPGELNETQRRGFHDGIEGARKDFENHRRANVENRDEFRNPELPRELREIYRDGFRRGYAVGVSHWYQAPAMAPPPAQPARESIHIGWEFGIDRFNDIQRRGYQDGMDGAHRDADNHRRFDPDNREEYRDPRVAPEFREDYRQGFRRGYEEAVAQMTGRDERGPWDAAPGDFSDIARRGFVDGMEGARRDVENRRRPDPNNRDEYRNPNVPPPLREDYRAGFRRGYERAMAHLMGDPGQR